jgi:hypothetical protein
MGNSKTYKPASIAKSWNSYFEQTTKKDLNNNSFAEKNENSTGYQLYAVNDQTISSGFIELSGNY